MSDLITLVVDNWVNYVFGSAIIAGLVILAAFLFYAVKNNWSIDATLVVGIPLVSILAAMLLPKWVFVIALIAIGTIIGLAFLKIINK